MSQFRRGIAPELLLSQVQNTLPYLFVAGASDTALGKLPPAKVIAEYSRVSAANSEPGLESEPRVDALTHVEYFKLCLSAHFLTVGTPVPTDVDNQIRLKLWPRELPLEDALTMADFVLESHDWQVTLLSSRYTCGAPGTSWEKEAVSGHLGEWFTVAAGAYCALKQYSEPLATAKRQELFEGIASEVRRHSEVFGSLWRAEAGLACLRASASIAHNFGDLDRVMDLWDLDVGDRLRLEYYKLAALPFDSNRKLRYLGRLWVAGELYKSIIEDNAGSSAMAHENHRYFALRKPKCLRQSPEFFIPIGPFFDEWARKLAKALATPEGRLTEASLEVVEALKHGWNRLPHTLTYGRALRGFSEVHPELDLSLLLKTPAYRKVLENPQARFEKKWSEEALKLMDEIPSRA
ncbi:MAG: hypothetical protein H7222_17085 [Methylotenera sp.]|nr:hypothetical protein [Oligoflexia bacterium]